MFNEDAMPVVCRCGKHYDFGDPRQGFQCDRCKECLCGECLPGSKEPRRCDTCEDADTDDTAEAMQDLDAPLEFLPSDTEILVCANVRCKATVINRVGVRRRCTSCDNREVFFRVTASRERSVIPSPPDDTHER